MQKGCACEGFFPLILPSIHTHEESSDSLLFPRSAPLHTCTQLAVRCVQEVPVTAQAVLPEPQQHGHHIAAKNCDTAQQACGQVQPYPHALCMGVIKLIEDMSADTENQGSESDAHVSHVGISKLKVTGVRQKL